MEIELAGGAGLVLARAESDALHVQELEPSGALAARWSVAMDLGNALVTLRSAEGTAFVDTLDLEGHVLARLADGALEPVLEAPGLILGPAQASDGHLWLSTHDALWRIEDGATPRHEVSRWLTCLDRVADRTYACTQDQVRAFVGPELGEVRMDLRELEPPRASDGDLLGDAQCAADWLLFRADLENIGVGASDGDASAERTTAKPITRGGAGCSLTALQPRSSPHAFLALAFFIATYRRRALRVRQRRPRGLL